MVYISIGTNHAGDIVYCEAFSSREEAEAHRMRQTFIMTELARAFVVNCAVRSE